MTAIVLTHADLLLLVKCGQKLGCRDATEVMGRAIAALADKINAVEQDQANSLLIEQAHQSQLHPSGFEWSTVVFGPPSGMNNEVYSLYGAHIEWDDSPAVVSCWKPTKEQLEQITQTGRLWLCVMGERMVPVCLLSESPAKLPWVKVIV